MNYKKNLRYFTRKKLRSASLICWIVAGICAAIFVILGSWMGSWSEFVYYLFWACVDIAPVAFVAGLICFSLSMGDRDYDNVCTALTEPFKTVFCDLITERMNKNATFGRTLYTPDVSRISLSGCYMHGEDLLSRRGSDNKYRSSEYAVTATLFDKGIFFVGYQINGITEPKKDEFFGAYKIEDIEAIEIKEREENFPAKYNTVYVKLKNGEEITFPQSDNAEFDRIVSTVRSKLTDK